MAETGNKAVLFLSDDCEWCKRVKALLEELGRDYVELDIRENSMAKAMAKKLCDGREQCLVVKGRVVTKFDKAKLADALLD